MYPSGRYFLVPKGKDNILSSHFLPPVPEKTNLAGTRPYNSQNQLNPLTPMSDQDRISPHNINTESSRQVRRIKKKTQLGNYGLIQYQILQIKIISILWQTEGRITNEILGVKGLRFVIFFINTWLSWSRHGQSESQNSWKYIFVLANIW